MDSHRKDQRLIKTTTGLEYFDFKQSDGAPVKDGQVVTIHYIVASSMEGIDDGRWIENSWLENKPIQFRIGTGQVLRGIDEGIRGAKIASHRRMILPPELGFGKRGVPNRVEPDSTLFFELYIISAEAEEA